MNNPLLNFSDLPKFNDIHVEHVLPALEIVLEESRAAIACLATLGSPTWDNFGAELENVDERLDRVWSPVSHLNSVQDSPELREAYEQGIALLTQYHVEVGQNSELFDRFKKIESSDSFSTLSAAQQKIIKNNIRDFRLSGAELSQSDKARFAEISQRLSELSTQFERNVLDASQAYKKPIKDVDKLAGLPDSALAMAKQFAEQEDLDGYLLTLQIPSYLAVMQHAHDRELRKEIYLAYGSRASDQGHAPEFDNQAIVDEILALKHEKAQLLGFNNYADLSLVSKMADSVSTVEQFLNDLVRSAKPVAEKELAALKVFAQERGHKGELEAWDTSYYSERLREERYAFTDEEVIPYFPAEQVFKGLFDVTNRLFGISVKGNTKVQSWHKDVQYFDVLDEDGEIIGGLFADLYVRKGKRGGAWMDTCIHRRQLGELTQLPVAYLICNFSPPIGSQPALLTHDEVETLFHEFGHTLHHLLSKVDEMSVAGINGVAWDAVELPSQFLENWCWQTQSLALIAAHVDTQAPLPTDLLEKMRAAKNFHSGMQTLRQVEFSLFDLRIHSILEHSGDDTSNVQSVLDQVRKEVAVSIPPTSNRFQNSFGHIFAGGYAAGYYSYKWAEVLSADAFDAFLEEGIFNSKTGNRFKQSILERGGIDDANKMFLAFRGRAPEIEPLLQQSGIL